MQTASDMTFTTSAQPVPKGFTSCSVNAMKVYFCYDDLGSCQIVFDLRKSLTLFVRLNCWNAIVETLIGYLGNHIRLVEYNRGKLGINQESKT